MQVTFTILVLSILGSYVVSLTATIPPDYALQDVDYLCNGSLKSNTTVVLDGGEHCISTICNISNIDNITIMGSSINNTTIHCEEGSGLQFVSVQQLTMERITFTSCGIILTNTENIFITTCVFQNNDLGGAVWSTESTGIISITNCTFQNNSATDGGAVLLDGSAGNVSITNCAFEYNSAADGGGAVWLTESTGNVSITNCAFEYNSAADGGGAVWLTESTGIVSITNCTFQYNSATDGGGAVLLTESTGIVSITNCTFQYNSATVGGGAVLLDGSSSNISITYCTFQNNSATYGGGAVWLFQSTGNVSITNCTFQNNSGTYGGGAVWLYVPTGNVSITNCAFQNNSATDGGGGGVGGGGGAVFLESSTGNVSITNCSFENNSATTCTYGGYGGGAVGWLESTGNVTVTNCIFRNNSATYGGAMWLKGSTGNVTITNCIFQNNSAAYVGGAVCIYLADLVIFDKSTFIINTAVSGAAVYATNTDDGNYLSYQLGHLILQEVIVENNQCGGSCNGYQKIRGGVFYFNVMTVDIIGDTITGSQFLSNSPLGAIQGEYGLLQLHGNISFYNNTGENGGAISLSNNVILYFFDGCSVEFSRNVATGFGGAIYNDGSQIENSNCVISIFNPNIHIAASVDITFTSNHAQQGGHAVYATPIYGCDCGLSCKNVASYFTITPLLPQDHNTIQVLSFPTYVQLCNCSDPDFCNITGQHEGKVTTYPGRTVRLNVTSIDDGNYLSPSVVYASIGTNGDTTTTTILGPGQEAQWIGTVCGTIEYQIYGPEMASLKLVLSTYPGSFPTVIEVELLPCEPGFIFMSNSSTCDCSSFFTSHGVVCDASDGTVTISKNNWIGVYNNTLPALASFCPLGYCNSAMSKLSLGRPEDLCSEGRTGIICGHCYGNYNVIFGSSQCQVCSDMWLITLVMFAVLGALLVATLFFLNLTVTQGTLYGLIFYANIVQVNTSIFFSQSTLRPLQVIVSFVNLDLGIPLCFYDGMDDADKAGLQFVFPAYLLILTMTVIVLCHYCLQRSPTTSTRFCVYRVFIIIGQRAVGVLSTLIYLSYSKLLRSVIDVFTYSTVHLPNNDMYVWFYDGNVEYLHGKHTVLFVIAMVTCALFLLPYIIALTFIPIIERYSEHNRLFNYLHKKANQIKPMNDAHYAPYKGEWRWWLGARLWLLVVMYSLIPVYSSDNPSLLLSIHATMVILFMLVQSRIEPFGQSLQKSKKSNRYINTNISNQFYNSLDLFYLLNYIALALSMSYILDQSSEQSQPTVVCVGVLVGLYVVVVMVTVLYHLIVAILKACGIYDRAREKIDRLFQRQCEVVVPATNIASTTTVTVSVGESEREPLLYED